MHLSPKAHLSRPSLVIRNDGPGGTIIILMIWQRRGDIRYTVVTEAFIVTTATSADRLVKSGHTNLI